MPLNSNLATLFAKSATEKDKKNKENKETIAYGQIIRKYENNIYYVLLDGSLSEVGLPISHYVTQIDIDDRVIVMIKNHSAIVTGNITKEAASTNYVNGLMEPIPQTEVEELWSIYNDNSDE